MAELTINNVRKTFDTVVALAGVNVTVEDGEFLILLGPSGCGKTTLLRIIAGIAEQDSGEVLVGEKRIDRLPPERRNVGMVFQSYALFPHMTVRGNLAFGLRMRGVRRAEVERRVGEVLDLVDLAGFADRFPRQLSGGQQQRVALARALVIEPEVLLLDEPLSNLDAKLRESLREDLRGLQRTLGTTSIYVTHDQAEAMALADRIVVMNFGHIVEVGAPVQLYREPKYRFTAEFLGSTNVIKAEVRGGVLELPWGDRLPFKGSRDGTATLSVRPEDIRLEPGATDANAQVEAVTFLGSLVQYQVRVGDTRLRMQSAGREVEILRRHDRVRIVLPEKPHVLAEDPPEQASVGVAVG